MESIIINGQYIDILSYKLEIKNEYLPEFYTGIKLPKCSERLLICTPTPIDLGYNFINQKLDIQIINEEYIYSVDGLIIFTNYYGSNCAEVYNYEIHICNKKILRKKFYNTFIIPIQDSTAGKQPVSYWSNNFDTTIKSETLLKNINDFLYQCKPDLRNEDVYEIEVSIKEPEEIKYLKSEPKPRCIRKIALVNAIKSFIKFAEEINK